MTNLDPASTDLVLRRAVELSTVEPASGEVELSAAAVADIAAEVGLPASTVASAIAEHQAGVDNDRSFLDRIIGPDQIWARRLSTSNEDDTRQRAQRWLSSSHGLKARVRPDGVVVANRRRGVSGMVAVGARRAGGHGGLGRVREVQVAAVDVDDKPGAVCVAADIGNKRSEAVAGGAVMVTSGAAVVGVVALFTGPATLAALPVVAGIGTLATRIMHQSRVRRITEEVEATIDGIATGVDPSIALTDKLRGRLNRTEPTVDPPQSSE